MIRLGKIGVGAKLLKHIATARDYIQDGLVVMWDGIENTGWGVHDASATMWKDLTGNGYDLLGHFTVKSNWQDDSMFFAGNESPPAYFSLDSVEESNELSGLAQSFGMTIKCSNVSRNGQLIVMPNAQKSCVVAPVKSKRLSIGYGNKKGFAFTSVDVWTSIYCGYDEPYAIVNNEVNNRNLWADQLKNPTIIIGGTGGAWLGFGGNVGNIRLYSRALTAEEIAHNYAIDKERFNLP